VVVVFPRGVETDSESSVLLISNHGFRVAQKVKLRILGIIISTADFAENCFTIVKMLTAFPQTLQLLLRGRRRGKGKGNKGKDKGRERNRKLAIVHTLFSA